MARIGTAGGRRKSKSHKKIGNYLDHVGGKLPPAALLEAVI
jgi:hypothetical protein